MSKDWKRYTVTSALPYANGPIHIGQLAGAYLPADIYVRYLRLSGKDVVYVCGSDEHGVAITLKAIRENSTPKQVVDKYHKLNKKSFEDFGIAFDIFHRTSDPLHHETAQAFFTALNNKGEFETETSAQYYDEENHLFLADRYITGTCPKCGYEQAYGDQCEKCGSSLSPTELINPVSTLSGKPPVLKKTRHWYLPMNKYEDWLKDWILKEHTEWKKNVYGQCKSWLEQGLQSRAMTRDLDWGVPVPLDDGDGKVLYVWLDAPIGYISATKAWAQQENKAWEPYWQSEDTRLVHFIGKDNIVFHCIIFPIILKAEGEYILPDNVPANEFMNMEGDKISTSRNWAVWLHEYLEEFPGKQDELRYVLTSNMPETKDSEFTWKDYQNKVNNELVGILGNFVNRVMVLQNKYFDGVVQPKGDIINQTGLEWGAGFISKITASLEQFRFREAQGYVMDIARAGNKFLTDQEPWKKIKEDPGGVGEILNASLQVIVNLAIVMEPFLPRSSKRMLELLNLDATQLKWEDAGNPDLVPEGHVIGKAALLFEKIEDKVIDQQIEKLMKTKESPVNDVEGPKEEITFDVFEQMDIRVGQILKAEKVKKADKLLQFEVDLGFEKRTILSGVAEYFSPEDLIGKRVSVLVNLKPRKIRGIVSQGMILLAEDAEKGLSFIVPEDELPNGSVIR
jgi:methionyl-tRNA synthetase